MTNRFILPYVDESFMKNQYKKLFKQNQSLKESVIKTQEKLNKIEKNKKFLELMILNLEEQFSKLKNKKDKLKHYDYIKNDNLTLIKKRKKLEKKFQKSEEEKVLIVNEKDGMKSELNKKKQTLVLNKNQIDELEDKNKDLNQELNQKLVNINELTKQKENLETILIQKDSEFDEKEIQFTKTSKQKEELEIEINKLREEKKNINLEFQEKNTTITTLKEKLKIEKDKLEKMAFQKQKLLELKDDELNNKHKEIVSIKKVIEKMRKKKNSYKTNCKTLSEQNGHSNYQLGLRVKEITELKNQSLLKQIQMDELEDKNKELNDELTKQTEKLETILIQKDSEFDEKEIQFKKTSRQKEDLEIEINKLREEKKNINLEFQETKRTITTLKEKLEIEKDKQKKTDLQKSTRDELEQEIDFYKASCSKKKEELERKNEEVKRNNLKVNEAKHKMELKLKEKENTIKELMKKIKSNQNNEEKKKYEKIEELNNELKTKKKIIKQQEETIMQFKKKNYELIQEKVSYQNQRNTPKFLQSYFNRIKTLIDESQLQNLFPNKTIYEINKLLVELFILSQKKNKNKQTEKTIGNNEKVEEMGFEKIPQEEQDEPEKKNCFDLLNNKSTESLIMCEKGLEELKKEQNNFMESQNTINQEQEKKYKKQKLINNSLTEKNEENQIQIQSLFKEMNLLKTEIKKLNQTKQELNIKKNKSSTQKFDNVGTMVNKTGFSKKFVWVESIYQNCLNDPKFKANEYRSDNNNPTIIRIKTQSNQNEKKFQILGTFTYQQEIDCSDKLKLIFKNNQKFRALFDYIQDGIEKKKRKYQKIKITPLYLFKKKDQIRTEYKLLKLVDHDIKKFKHDNSIHKNMKAFVDCLEHFSYEKTEYFFKCISYNNNYIYKFKHSSEGREDYNNFPNEHRCNKLCKIFHLKKISN
ncbi:nuclear mitotic apparatus protein [Anaeramoeba flamelloides]|uniref:Nuclear mitotic apparatus protein n=1 Tax=Anaeramoeba flamelloides TaxID=1746091 RepID=A0ABQ8Z318_9EUKA|nr:nuclear mitotic apparatus protein [Anaeramoeba flamelloides]